MGLVILGDPKMHDPPSWHSRSLSFIHQSFVDPPTLPSTRLGREDKLEKGPCMAHALKEITIC